jgi:hypothetical protein
LRQSFAYNIIVKTAESTDLDIYIFLEFFVVSVSQIALVCNLGNVEILFFFFFFLLSNLGNFGYGAQKQPSPNGRNTRFLQVSFTCILGNGLIRTTEPLDPLPLAHCQETAAHTFGACLTVENAASRVAISSFSRYSSSTHFP